MVTSYKVTVTVTADQFMEIMPHLSGIKTDIKKVDLFQQNTPDTRDPYPATPHRERQTRTPRGSKVNTTVLAALANGPQTAKQLKTALEEAGYAPGSLSTAIATMQKSGEIYRQAEGIYAIAQLANQTAAQ